jgi:CheY-like chemotaxis protein
MSLNDQGCRGRRKRTNRPSETHSPKNNASAANVTIFSIALIGSVPRRVLPCSWLYEKSRAPPTRTVCLVDDEPDIAAVIKKGLEQYGFTVHDFRDPKKALEHFRLNGKDCTFVLSDVRMPGMTGFELCRQIKEMKQKAPVVLMTAFEINSSEFDKVLPHTKADGFITKPFTTTKLIDVMKQLDISP